MSDFGHFIANLHPTTKLVGTGVATVMDKTMNAVVVRNLYGQLVVWGPFSVDKGKFKGKIANNAGTEGVSFKMAVLHPDTMMTPEEITRNSHWFEYMINKPGAPHESPDT